MKKLSLITLALLTLLLAQCKKEKIDNNSGTDVKKVKVRCEVPMGDEEKTDFDLFNSGSVTWSTGIERLYLAVSGDDYQIIELTAEATVEGATTLAFEGEIPEGILQENEVHQLWYFGNSMTAPSDNYNFLNVNLIPHENQEEERIIGVEGVISDQSGNREDLGYYHIAKGSAKVESIEGEITLNIKGKLENQMAIAYMDLRDVSRLEGSAIVGTFYSLQYNEKSGQYEFLVEDNSDVINIKGNTDGAESYVVLFPNTLENGEIISVATRERYYFKEGIEKSNFYYNDINNPTPLVWEEYPYSNEHEYVDLGLPSGTRWAKYNIGVNSADLQEAKDYYGHYFLWSHVVDVKSDDGPYYEDMPECIQGTEYDAATAYWGENWGMPTKDQMQELIDECTWLWTENFENVSGLNGYKVTSRKDGNTDKYIFLPAACYYETWEFNLWNGYWFENDGKIHYWTANMKNWIKPYSLKQTSSGLVVTFTNGDYYENYYAYTVRAVFIPPTNEE